MKKVFLGLSYYCFWFSHAGIKEKQKTPLVLVPAGFSFFGVFFLFPGFGQVCFKLDNSICKGNGRQATSGWDGKNRKGGKDDQFIFHDVF